MLMLGGVRSGALRGLEMLEQARDFRPRDGFGDEWRGNQCVNVQAHGSVAFDCPWGFSFYFVITSGIGLNRTGHSLEDC